MGKVFIGGSKSINKLPTAAIEKLNNICSSGDDIIIGDAFGVDKAVQEYLASINYHNVTIYASDGKVRNNVGNWHIVATQSAVKSGYDFYKQKDIVMTNDCDYGFMVWDGKSRGTKNNIIRIVENSKVCEVYLQSNEGEYAVTNSEQLDELLYTAHKINVSKYMALILRHKPYVAGVTLDENGWTDIYDLMEKINNSGRDIDCKLLNDIVATDGKGRYLFNDDKTKIRANQGHSINVDVQFKEATPPNILYHGTAERFLESIKAKGILSMNRCYVQLSQDVDTAFNVGSRHGKAIVLVVDTAKMVEDGYKFWLSENNVWQSNTIPWKYVVDIIRE
jgi:putative RNA 2'-phosphotransferase